jgi:hypothetical protein
VSGSLRSCAPAFVALATVGALVASLGSGGAATPSSPCKALRSCPAFDRSVASGGTRIAPPRRTRIRWRFAYSNRPSQNLAARYGYNLIDVSTVSEANAVPAGTKAQVWLYDYDNTSCSWEKSDAYIRSIVSQLANDPKVAGFYFSNEPDPIGCPTAVQQHRERNALIKSLAPRKYTLIGIDANWRDHFDRQAPMWVGAADYINYNPYVCFTANRSTCDYAWEDHVLSVAKSLHQPFFVAIQAFREAEWRWPSPREERTMLEKLCGSGAQGYLTFSWNWNRDPLLNHPGLLREIKRFNLHGCVRRPSVDASPPAQGQRASTLESLASSQRADRSERPSCQ